MACSDSVWFPARKSRNRLDWLNDHFVLLGPPFENIAEQLLGLAAIEEVLLVGCALVSVTGRHRDAVDTQVHGGVEKLCDAIGLRGVEQVQLMLTRKPRSLACLIAVTARS